MFLAGDVGGTKTLLGLFSPGEGERPAPIEVGEFVTLDYDGLEAIVREFVRAQNVSPRQIQVACFGVAGAVTDNVARLSNVPWLVDVRAVSERCATRSRCSSPTSSPCCSRVSRCRTATPRWSPPEPAWAKRSCTTWTGG